MFPYAGSGTNCLSMEIGDRVVIISHDGESTGWWKGRIDNRVSNTLINHLSLTIFCHARFVLYDS